MVSGRFLWEVFLDESVTEVAEERRKNGHVRSYRHSLDIATTGVWGI